MRSIIIWGPPRGNPTKWAGSMDPGKVCSNPVPQALVLGRLRAHKPRTEHPQCLPDLYLLAFEGIFVLP